MDTKEIKATIENLLQRLTVDFDTVELIDDEATHHRPQFLITSTDSRLLIGNQGAGLSALNHIIRQIVRRRATASDPKASFFVDVNQYYSKRIDEIVYQANRMAERAELFKRDVEMLPMSPYERMIVHSHFTDHPHIMTESQGEGRFRRVIVKYSTEPLAKEMP